MRDQVTEKLTKVMMDQYYDGYRDFGNLMKKGIYAIKDEDPNYMLSLDQIIKLIDSSLKNTVDKE